MHKSTLTVIALATALAACGGSDVELPVIEQHGAEALNLDKALASADEVAAAIKVRTVLDTLVDPQLFHSPDGHSNSAAVGACYGEPSVVWQETQCSGLSGWGIDISVFPCELGQEDAVSGHIFHSYSDLIAQHGPDSQIEQVEATLEAIRSEQGPLRTVRYAVDLTGFGGAQIDACGTYSGSIDQNWTRETADADVGPHQGRLVWQGQRMRVDPDAPSAQDLSEGTLDAQFPRGGLTDPFRFELRSVARNLDSNLPWDGHVVQRGWDGDVIGRIDGQTLEAGSVHVERPDGAGVVVLPTL